MDSSRFDAITRLLSGGTSRRAALRGILGVLAGGAIGFGVTKLPDVQAAGTCSAIGKGCHDGSKCCSGFCGNGVCMCPCGTTNCNGACVDTANDPRNCGGCGVVCASGTCSHGTCVAPTATCTDGIKNGQETDVDCGGPACPPCADGKHCLVNSDCQSGVCSGGICAAPTCNDGVKNGSETDVDCGGACPPCASGKHCLVNSDCQSGSCVAGICACPAGQTNCGNGCTNTATDPRNCGGCGVVCPAGPNSTAVCSSGTCSIVCNAGFADCNGNPADGCECTGTVCCPGGTCQTAHNDGLGDTFRDCVPLGTYNQQQALEACGAYATSHGASASVCSPVQCAGVTSAVAYTLGGIGPIWSFSGTAAGHVSASSTCPTTFDAAWN